MARMPTISRNKTRSMGNMERVRQELGTIRMEGMQDMGRTVSSGQVEEHSLPHIRLDRHLVRVSIPLAIECAD